jgi:predicted ATPase with chaperone activity
VGFVADWDILTYLKLQDTAVMKPGLSTSAEDRIGKRSRTVADLEEAPNILPRPLREAMP